MQIRFSKLTLLLFLAMWMPSTEMPAGAQTLDLETLRQAVSPVSASWRYHAGDDARWALPGFDDAAWKSLTPTKEWTNQGYSEVNGLAWFRFKLRVPARMTSLVIQMPRMEKNYQLFADGRLIGQVGSMPPQEAQTVTAAARLFTLPLHAGGGAQEMTLALRMWGEPTLAEVRTSSMRGAALAGEASVMTRLFAQGKAAVLLSRGSDYTVDILVLILCGASVLLYWLTRKGFYLWIALSMLLQASVLPVQLAAAHYGWTFLQALYAYSVLDFLGTVALDLFILGMLNQFRRRYVVAVVLLSLMADVLPTLTVLGKVPLVWSNGVYLFCALAMDLLLIWLLIRGWRKGRVDAKLLLIPYVLFAVIAEMDNAGHWLQNLKVPHAEQMLSGDILLLTEPFTVRLQAVGKMISLLGLLAVLIYRFARTTREEQRLATALQAAHDIQHRLVPVDIPSLGGLTTEVVYFAAEEVGGDFCQVLPRADGSILVAIGDVSGKGLQAAMMGTLAVGALRSIADEKIEPGAALSRLNQVLLRTENAGFITCLCLVLTQAGKVTMANAGHLAPYLDGVEMELEADLPLGILPGLAYDQRSFWLPERARLTLLSDGVVEARSQSGELFGFERTTEVSQRRASDIAAEAREHGQQDDITVITLDWYRPARVADAA